MKKKDKLKFYKSKEWKKKRKEIIERDNNECQLCKRRGKVTAGQQDKMDVHHKEFLEKNWERRLDNDNLITLCKRCHNEMHPEKLAKRYSEIHGEFLE